MNQMDDVLLIGAGIIGTSIARELSRYQLKVRLIEKEVDVSMGATKANSAIVHGGFAESHKTLKGQLCYQGRVRFQQLEEELHFGFRETGSFVVTLEEDNTPLLALLENGRRNGLNDLSIVDGDAMRHMEPAMTLEVKWGLHCRGAGVCSPFEMAIAMAENAIKNGVVLHLEEEVIAIRPVEDYFVVTTTKGEYFARYVINAAGIYADKIARMVGLTHIELRPVSGEYLLFARGSGEVFRNTIFQLPTALGKGVLVASTYYGNLLLGPDASLDESKQDTSTHVERLANIYQQAKIIYPTLNPGAFIRSFSGIRAKSQSGDFVIEESSMKGFINVAGIQSPGLTASPAIARLVVDILKTSGLIVIENPLFDPYRKPIILKKALKPLKEVQPFLALPLGSTDRIVCRCEQVREAEIVDALHRGIKVKSVDGVKRRTRATMGWCQGEFCKSRVIEVMERENQEPVDGSYDIEHSGVNRVQKPDLLAYLKQQIK